MPTKIHEIPRLLKKDGWVLVGTRGSHQQFEHPAKPGKVIAGKRNDDLSPGTLKSILIQAQLSKDDL